MVQENEISTFTLQRKSQEQMTSCMETRRIQVLFYRMIFIVYAQHARRHHCSTCTFFKKNICRAEYLVYSVDTCRNIFY